MVKCLFDWFGGLIVFDVWVEVMVLFVEGGVIVVVSVFDVVEVDIISIIVFDDV